MDETPSSEPIEWSSSMEDVVRKAVKTWCYRLNVFIASDIEDLEQDAILIAWRRCENRKIKYKEGLWFIARSVVLNFRAEKGRGPSTCMLEDCDTFTFPNPLDKILLEDLEKEFPKLMTLASARVDGFEWNLIAENLGVYSPTLRMQYHREIRKARKSFMEENID